jgi:predicted methyltransferase MtxX (methanogen marker protein 4)
MALIPFILIMVLGVVGYLVFRALVMLFDAWGIH